MKKILSIIFILILSVFYTMPCFAEVVVYNTKTGKIHSTSCKWAKKCTVNCIRIDRKEAVKRGGVPCKVCGGR